MVLKYSAICTVEENKDNEFIEWLMNNIGLYEIDWSWGELFKRGTVSNLWEMEVIFRTEEQRTLFELTWL